jgi:predicted amidohydrolase
MQIAAIQFDSIYRDPHANREKVVSWLKQAMSSQPDIIILPETWTTGYSENVFHNIAAYAETENGPTLNLLRKFAHENNVWVVTGSFPEKDGEKFYNTVWLLNRNGDIVGKYRKMHLYTAMDEQIGFQHGTNMPVFETEFGPVALMTCYDIRFPELSRTYALRGAQLLIVVSNFPNPKINHWRTLLQARSIENQLSVIAVNRVGAAEGNTYFGASLIIDAWGDILAEGTAQESILTAAVDVNKCQEVRQRIPMFADRQPSSYPDDLLKKAAFV